FLFPIYVLRSASSRTSLSRGDDQLSRAKSMWIMVVYVLIIVVSESVVVIIGLVLDRIYPALSLPVSLSLFFAALWLPCILPVRFTDPKRAKKAKHAT